jgi:hypothetical protein
MFVTLIRSNNDVLPDPSIPIINIDNFGGAK